MVGGTASTASIKGPLRRRTALDRSSSTGNVPAARCAVSPSSPPELQPRCTAAPRDLLSQEVRQQRRALACWISGRPSGRAAGASRLAMGRGPSSAQPRRALALASAAETANRLVFNLAQKFRDSGVPVGVIEDILDRAQAPRINPAVAATGGCSSSWAAATPALDETARELLAIGDTKGSACRSTAGASPSASYSPLRPAPTRTTSAVSRSATSTRSATY